MTQSVSDAAAQGDRSENAEYIYGKKRLREIDRRVRYLSKRLEDFTVVSGPPDDTSKIYFGACVSLDDEEGNRLKYRLVGPDELDPQRGHISIDAPMGLALLGKQIEAEIEIESPTGVMRYCVVNIEYPEA